MVVRIFFSADVHGSTLVWRKWLSAAETYDVNTIILSGDLTGKVLVPIIDHGNGKFSAKYFGRRWVLDNNNELKEFEERLEGAGAYFAVVTKGELEELKENQQKVSELMNEKIAERLRKWLDMLSTKIEKTKVTAIVYPGNDDELFIDSILKEYSSEGILFPENQVVEIGTHEAVFSAYVNPTPWNTPREMDERDLERYLIKNVEKVRYPNNAIFVFHPPPHGTMLDLAPQLTSDLKPVVIGGSVQYVHVGSVSVRRIIERYQPLLGLHGHIHESSGAEKIGRSVVVNPGSEYSEGILKGFIVDLNANALEKYWKVEG